MNHERGSDFKPQITVYYDGLCHLCSREINHYKTMNGASRIQFTDITSAYFDAQAEGLDPLAVHQSLHVKDRNGVLHLGVDAFVTIWNELTALRFLVPIVNFKIANLKPFYFVLKTFYSIFAKLRPWLPRKACESSPYCEVGLKK